MAMYTGNMDVTGMTLAQVRSSIMWTDAGISQFGNGRWITPSVSKPQTDGSNIWNDESPYWSSDREFLAALFDIYSIDKSANSSAQTGPEAHAADTAAKVGYVASDLNTAAGLIKTAQVVKITKPAGRFLGVAAFGIDYANYHYDNIGLGHLVVNWGVDALGMTGAGTPFAVAYGYIDNFSPGGWRAVITPTPGEADQVQYMRYK